MRTKEEARAATRAEDGHTTKQPARGKLQARTDAHKSMLAAARRYIEAGWKLIPLDGKVPQKDPVKRKRIGVKQATDDIAVVKEWVRRWPDMGLGGTPPEGTAIVDVDIYKDPDALQPLADELAERGPWQRTQSGGAHFLVAEPVPSQGDLCKHHGVKGIDVRQHDKGYIVLAPSAGYTWERKPWDAPVPKLPHSWLNGHEHQPEQKNAKTPKSIPTLWNEREAKKVRRDLKVLDPDVDYPEWIRIGQALHSADPALSGPAFAAWLRWSEQGSKFKDENDLRFHWESFGQQGGVTLATLFGMAKDAKPHVDGEAPRLEPKKYDLGVLADTDMREVEIYVDGLLSQGAFLMVALYKFGKTFLALQLAAALNTGKVFLGMPVPKKRKVALLALEEGGDQQDEGGETKPPSMRLASRLRRMGLSKETHGVSLYFDVGEDPVAFMARVLDEHDVVIVDSLAKLKTMMSSADGNIWQNDYKLIDMYRGPAQRRAKLLLFLTHASKIGNHVDPEAAINSTGGSLSAADGFFVLQRPDKHDQDRVRLSPLGRDAPNTQLELRFHPTALTWRSLGPWVHLSPIASSIFMKLGEQPKHIGLPYGDLAQQLGTSAQTVQNECVPLRRAGLIESTGRMRNPKTKAFEGATRVQLSREGWQRYAELQEFEAAKLKQKTRQIVEEETGLSEDEWALVMG